MPWTVPIGHSRPSSGRPAPLATGICPLPVISSSRSVFIVVVSTGTFPQTQPIATKSISGRRQPVEDGHAVVDTRVAIEDDPNWLGHQALQPNLCRDGPN